MQNWPGCSVCSQDTLKSWSSMLGLWKWFFTLKLGCPTWINSMGSRTEKNYSAARMQGHQSNLNSPSLSYPLDLSSLYPWEKKKTPERFIRSTGNSRKPKSTGDRDPEAENTSIWCPSCSVPFPTAQATLVWHWHTSEPPAHRQDSLSSCLQELHLPRAPWSAFLRQGLSESTCSRLWVL